MIVSHARKFIFLKPEKVAGTSVEILLSRHCGPGDIVTPISEEPLRTRHGGRSPQNHLVPLARMSAGALARMALRRERPLKFYNHMPADRARALLGEEIWRGYLKVSITRNPFDQAVSRYFWLKAQGKTADLEGMLFDAPEHLVSNRRIAPAEGPDAMDVMLRYERLEADLAALLPRLGIAAEEAARLREIDAKAGIRPARASAAELFARRPDAARLVGLLCRDELERFGYALDARAAHELAPVHATG